MRCYKKISIENKFMKCISSPIKQGSLLTLVHQLDRSCATKCLSSGFESRRGLVSYILKYNLYVCHILSPLHKKSVQRTEFDSYIQTYLVPLSWLKLYCSQRAVHQICMSFRATPIRIACLLEGKFF